MSVLVLVSIINMLAGLLSTLVFVTVLLSWFLPPYHPVREALDRLIDPFLAPIRRFIPSAGMFDFSPLILILLIEVIAQILKSLVLSLQ